MIRSTTVTEATGGQRAGSDPRTDRDHTAVPSQDSRLGQRYYYVANPVAR